MSHNHNLWEAIEADLDFLLGILTVLLSSAGGETHLTEPGRRVPEQTFSGTDEGCLAGRCGSVVIKIVFYFPLSEGAHSASPNPFVQLILT